MLNARRKARFSTRTAALGLAACLFAVVGCSQSTPEDTTPPPDPAVPPVTSDWPQFLGPNRDMTSPETHLLRSWPEGGPPLLWETAVERGFSGASIVGDEVFLLERTPDGDMLRVLSLDTGEDLWSYTYEAPGRVGVQEGSRATATVTDDMVYIVGSLGAVVAVSRETHEPVWSLKLMGDIDHDPPRFGYAQSPLVHGDKLILVPVDPNSPGMVALNRADGREIWRSEPFGGESYASPSVRTVAGAQGILHVGADRVVFVNPDDGAIQWQFDDWACETQIPAPTVMEDGEHVFVTGGYEAGSVMLKITKSESGFDVAEAWRMKQGTQMHVPFSYNGYLYMTLNERHNLVRNRDDGGLACINPADGAILWNTGPEPYFHMGNLMLAEGKIYILDGLTAELVLINPTPDGYSEISRFTAFPNVRAGAFSNSIWAPMSLSHGKLIVRDHELMRCFDLRAE